MANPKDQQPPRGFFSTEGGIMDPRMMGLLALGSSLMQQSGWRNRPVTSEEQWGRAIPAGMLAYAQQSGTNLIQQQAEAEAQQAQAEAEAQQAALEQQQAQFTQTVLTSPLSEPIKNNLLAMWRINPAEAVKRLDQHLTPKDEKDEKATFQVVTPEEAKQAGLDPKAGVYQKNMLTGEYKLDFPAPKTPAIKWIPRIEAIENPETGVLEMRHVLVDPNNPKNKQIGEITGDVTGIETAKVLAEKQAAAEAQRQIEFAQTFGLSKDKFEAQKAQHLQTFNEGVRQYTGTDAWKKLSQVQKKTELDRKFNQDIRAFEEQLRATAEREKFTEDQIRNQVNQYRETLEVRKSEFEQTLNLGERRFSLSEERLGWSKEEAALIQKNWEQSFKQGAAETQQAFDERVRMNQHTITQDGLRNDYTDQQITNQVEQYRETFERQGVQFDETQDLKELIFEERQMVSARNFVEQVRQYTESAKVQAAEADISQENFDKRFEQTLVEHLATIKQQGIRNDYTGTQIEMAQQRFLASQVEFGRKHGLAEDRFDFQKLKHSADQEHKALKLAQEVLKFEYQKGRDTTGDKQWQQGHQHRIDQELERIEQFGVTSGFARERIDIQKGQFLASLEFQKQKLATEEGKIPVTLYGQSARAWAKENKFPLREKGMPVVKFDKFGNFSGKVDYLRQGKYGDKQLAHLTAAQKNWMTNPDTKGANKLGRLLTSLERLAKDGTGVSEFAMIYKFMKALDETSTVLASEFRNASSAGRSALDNLMQWGDKQFTGSQLRPEQKLDVLNAIRSVAYSTLTDTVRPNKKAALELSSQHGIDEQDMKAVLPDVLEDYFKRKPYVEKGEAPKEGAIKNMTDQQATKAIDNL